MMKNSGGAAFAGERSRSSSGTGGYHNAVLSHLDLDDLIADVARETIIFSVWLQSVWYWAIIERTEVQPVVQRSFCLTLCVSATLMPGESVLLTQTLQTRQPTLSTVQTICFSGNATRYYTYLH